MENVITEETRNSSGDETANVNILRRHRTRTTAHNEVHFAYGKHTCPRCQMRLLQRLARIGLNNARCYGWRDTSENRSEIGDFAPTRSLWLKISGTRGRPPPIIFAQLVRPMNSLQLCRWQFSHKKNFVADFLQAKCDFTRKSAFLHFWAPLWET